MRKDLAKCTTERERVGSKNKSRKYGGRVKVVHDLEHEYEDERGGFYSSARRRQYGYNNKHFTDVLNPIKGNLRKNVGRLWNDVYSEFCKSLDKRSVSGQHIIDHLMDYVTINPYYGDDGNVYFNEDAYWKWSMSGGIIYGYYVHPVTGILSYKEYERIHYVKPKAKVTEIPLIDGTYYHKNEKGYWFRIRYVRRSFLCYCPIKDGIIEHYDYCYGREIIKCCNRKEIKRINDYINGVKSLVKERINGRYIKHRKGVM